MNVTESGVAYKGRDNCFVCRLGGGLKEGENAQQQKKNEFKKAKKEGRRESEKKKSTLLCHF